MPVAISKKAARARTAAAQALERAGDEVALARREIRHGRFQRSMAVVAGISAVVSGLEAYVQHRRGAFAHWLMWTPVWLTPPAALAAGAAVVSKRAARRWLPAVSLVSLADGVIGFGYHLRGIRRMPGGFGLGQYNVVMGPPVFAPLLTCSVGVMGLLAGALRRERPPRRLRHGGTLLERLGSAVGRKRGRVGGPIDRMKAEIAGGQFQRGLAITSAVFAVLAGGEAYFEHLRGSFNQRVMWTPVLVTPPMVAAAIGAATSGRVARQVLPFTSAAAFLDGLLGFALHLRGLRRMPGGPEILSFKLMLGPPVFAPLLFCSVGLLGAMASLQRRGKD